MIMLPVQVATFIGSLNPYSVGSLSYFRAAIAVNSQQVENLSIVFNTSSMQQYKIVLHALVDTNLGMNFDIHVSNKNTCTFIFKQCFNVYPSLLNTPSDSMAKTM